MATRTHGRAGRGLRSGYEEMLYLWDGLPSETESLRSFPSFIAE